MEEIRDLNDLKGETPKGTMRLGGYNFKSDIITDVTSDHIEVLVMVKDFLSSRSYL